MSEPAARRFWEWFARREQAFRDLDSDKPALIDEFYDRLVEYQPGLAFEIQSPEDGGSREIIISAHGDPDLFPQVRSLVASSPASDYWTVVAFKQPLGFDFTHARDGLTFDPSEMWFEPTTPGGEQAGELGLLVYLGFEDPQQEIALAAVWTILETALGEVAINDEIHNLAIAPLPPDPTEYVPLRDLPAFIEWRRKRTH